MFLGVITPSLRERSLFSFRPLRWKSLGGTVKDNGKHFRQIIGQHQELDETQNVKIDSFLSFAMYIH
jgi:hypothetical protein